MTKLNEEFAFLVLAIVAEIPRGKVATYGQIAELAGYPRNSRLVGKVLSHGEYYGRYPCQRVVNAQGSCAKNWPQQPALLQAEGVVFRENGSVDLQQCRWNGDR